MQKEYEHITRYNKGEMIFNKGDTGDCMYEVLDGEVGIYLNYKKPNEKLLAIRKPGEFFGEIALIEVVPRTAAAVAMDDDTSLRIVGVKGVGPYLRKNPAVMEKILGTMSERIKQGRTLYLETCGVLAKYKETVENNERPDKDLTEQMEKCLKDFDKYQSKFGAGV